MLLLPWLAYIKRELSRADETTINTVSDRTNLNRLFFPLCMGGLVAVIHGITNSAINEFFLISQIFLFQKQQYCIRVFINSKGLPLKPALLIRMCLIRFITKIKLDILLFIV